MPTLNYPSSNPCSRPQPFPHPCLLPMSKLDELIINVRASSSYSSLSLYLLGEGGVDMNLMKHNMEQMELAEYKADLLSLLGRIMGRGEVYISRGGSTVNTMVS